MSTSRCAPYAIVIYIALKVRNQNYKNSQPLMQPGDVFLIGHFWLSF